MAQAVEEQARLRAEIESQEAAVEDALAAADEARARVRRLRLTRWPRSLSPCRHSLVPGGWQLLAIVQFDRTVPGDEPLSPVAIFQARAAEKQMHEKVEQLKEKDEMIRWGFYLARAEQLRSLCNARRPEQADSLLLKPISTGLRQLRQRGGGTVQDAV